MDRAGGSGHFPALSAPINMNSTHASHLSLRHLRNSITEHLDHLEQLILENEEVTELSPYSPLRDQLEQLFQIRDENDRYILDSMDAEDLQKFKARWNLLAQDHEPFDNTKHRLRDYEDYEDVIDNWCNIIRTVDTYVDNINPAIFYPIK